MDVINWCFVSWIRVPLFKLVDRPYFKPPGKTGRCRLICDGVALDFRTTQYWVCTRLHLSCSRVLVQVIVSHD